MVPTPKAWRAAVGDAQVAFTPGAISPGGKARLFIQPMYIIALFPLYD